MSHSGQPAHTVECPLSGVKRTCPFALQMSANDPKRTLAGNPKRLAAFHT
jgi:hypothetical protein